MRYPDFLPIHGTIGIIAPSFGVFGHPYTEKYNNAKKKFLNLGYKIKESEHIWGNEVPAASSNPRIRAEEFMKMYLDEEVDLIISVAGGEIMMEMLPYIDFLTISKAKPKYILGYSDNTNLTFTLPILTNTAAMYGPNFTDFGQNQWDKSIQDSFEIITGKRLELDSYQYYQIDDLTKQEGHELDGYNLTEINNVKSVSGHEEHFAGRLIGGCLECLQELCGTKFADMRRYLDTYCQEGIIWYIEACDMNILSQYRALWQMKQCDMFKYCTGVIYGREGNNEELFDVKKTKMLQDIFGCVPIIYDADFGHVMPSWTIISGAYCDVIHSEVSTNIKYILR